MFHFHVSFFDPQVVTEHESSMSKWLAIPFTGRRFVACHDRHSKVQESMQLRSEGIARSKRTRDLLE